MISKEDEEVLKQAENILSEYTRSKKEELLPQMVVVRQALMKMGIMEIPFECECNNSERILRAINSLGNIILENAKEIIF